MFWFQFQKFSRVGILTIPSNIWVAEKTFDELCQFRLFRSPLSLWPPLIYLLARFTFDSSWWFNFGRLLSFNLETFKFTIRTIVELVNTVWVGALLADDFFRQLDLRRLVLPLEYIFEISNCLQATRLIMMSIFCGLEWYRIWGYSRLFCWWKRVQHLLLRVSGCNLTISLWFHLLFLIWILKPQL